MLHVLHGEDDFSAREALNKLLRDPRFIYSTERFDGAGAEIGAIREACETMPFLSDGRLVIVEGLPKPKREAASKESDEAPTKAEAEAAPAKGKGKRAAKKPTATALAREFAGTLAEIGSHLPATTTLAIIVAETLPKTHPLVEAAEAHGKLHLFMPPTGPALEKWITARAQLEHATLTPDALKALANLANGQLRVLANEIAKLATYVGPEGVITAQTVQLLVPDSRETRVFDLTDALARGERGPALRLLHELLADGQPPLMILALVARQVRTLTQVKDLAAQGARPPEIASMAGLAPFLVEKTLNQARRFSIAQLEAAQRACLEVDTALKRSRLAPDLALDLLLTEFGRG
jgi:DNA polymerase-3 subunit delta